MTSSADSATLQNSNGIPNTSTAASAQLAVTPKSAGAAVSRRSPLTMRSASVSAHELDFAATKCWCSAAASLLLALAAIGAALHQHFVAARSSSCALTLADRIVSGLRLDSAMPAIFGVTASCADAAVDVFGVPFEFWSVALSALLVTASLQVLWRR